MVYKCSVCGYVYDDSLFGLKPADKVTHIFKARIFSNGDDLIACFGQSLGRFFYPYFIDVFGGGFPDIFFKIPAEILGDRKSVV